MSVYKEYIRRNPHMDKSVLAEKMIHDGVVDATEESILRSIRRASQELEDFKILGDPNDSIWGNYGDGQYRFYTNGLEIPMGEEPVAALFRWYPQKKNSKSVCKKKLYNQFNIEIPEDILTDILKILDLTKSSSPVPPHGLQRISDNPEEHYEEILRLQVEDDLNDIEDECWKSLYKKEREKTVTAERAVSAAVEKLADREFPQFQGPYIRRPTGERGDLVILLGDWHVGLDVNMRVNKYNKNIFYEYVNLLSKKIDQHMMRSNVEYKSLNYVMLGDMVDGPLANMHADQYISQDLVGIEQPSIAADGMIHIIQNGYARTGAEVNVVSVGGNHGRVAPDRTEDPTRFGDQAAYEMARKVLSRTIGDKLSWDRSEKRLVEFGVQDIHFVATHGDQVTKNLDNLVFALQRHPNDEMVVLTAHEHEMLVEHKTRYTRVRNGALCGANHFALECVGANTGPSQAMLEIIGGQIASIHWLRL